MDKTGVIDTIALRRQDRAVADEEWIQRMLETAPYATMGLSSDPYPHLNMNTFYFDRDEHAIYFHTSREGATRMQVGAGRKVTLTVSSMGRLLPAKTATKMSVEYRSVMVRGEIAVVDDRDVSLNKMTKFVEKYFPHLKPGTDFEPISQAELDNISVYRISIEAWIGKRKRERDDFPGAFLFGAHKR
jgi:nitroimidazol reductase NimA-like FMN-containing flavoprotein (pyridoxamine 5'-phosphate oxidase superfamily)